MPDGYTGPGLIAVEYAASADDDMSGAVIKSAPFDGDPTVLIEPVPEPDDQKSDES